MKFADIENKSLKELIKQKQDLTSQLFEMKMKNSLGQLANPVQIRVVRKNIAQINTAIVKKSVR
ncbi:MAG: 50S ribosomal protein L29 [Pseudobdellovibrio sp.]|jgi:large subunit ribosomal protein L29|uniref:50S ribosomal protein L29 n=1 Tax=Pseudobdellovibrio sp. HCB154 TaxID=3386277 RepID=UPI00391749FA|nr:50S ribosomal protein L29 [Pseudobdellovibrio sp.]